MLGSVSHCAPKQLASCLPKEVPKLIDSFSETHPKVKITSFQALEEIATVVRNPEIQNISSTLLNALVDPAQGTLKALETMIHTEFLHSVSFHTKNHTSLLSNFVQTIIILCYIVSCNLHLSEHRWMHLVLH